MNNVTVSGVLRLAVFGLAMTVIAGISLAASQTATAADTTYTAALTGANEVPPISATSTATTTGSGMFVSSGTGTSTTLSAQLYATSSSPIIGAHLHCAAAGTNGPIVVPLYASSTGATNMSTTSTSTTVFAGLLVNMTIHESDIATTTAAGCGPAITSMAGLIDAINAGTIYANVHTLAWPNGAARGQLVALATSTPTTTPSQVTITTALASSSIPVGGSTHDTASISGASTTPTGTVTYAVYSDNACTQGAQSAGTKTVTNGNVPNSDALTFNTAGTYYWQAHYSGDAYNSAATSTCASEALVVTPVIITPATPTLTTNATPGPVTIGNSITDTAHLSGAVSSATGTIAFNVYAPGDTVCASPTAVPPTKTVSGNGDYTSGSFTTAATGTYRWRAFYSGDMHNNATSTSCNDANESTLVVSATTTPTATTTPRATTTVTTTLVPAGPIMTGTSVHDTAALSGATGNATGTVTYRIFSDNACNLLASMQPASPTVTVANGTVPDSGSVVFWNAGTYYWQAAYSGDMANLPSASLCTSETLVVNPTTTPTTTPPVTGSRTQEIIDRLQEAIQRIQSVQERIRIRLGGL